LPFGNALDIENQYDGGHWTEMLSDKYFGSSDPMTGRILDGRWKDQTVPFLDEAFLQKQGVDPYTTFFPYEEDWWLKVAPAHITSPYGLLRSPWYYNPSPYLARYHAINLPSISDVPFQQRNRFSGVTCDEMSGFLRDFALDKPLSTFLYFVEGTVHGNFHFTFGGAGGDHMRKLDQILVSKFNFTPTHRSVVAQAAQAASKSYLSITHVRNTRVIFNCSAWPVQNGVVISTASPGETGGPACTCNIMYLVDDESLLSFFNLYTQDSELLSHITA
jgi:hypothetical protein